MDCTGSEPERGRSTGAWITFQNRVWIHQFWFKIPSWGLIDCLVRFWLSSGVPVQFQCSFSAVSVQFRCNFKLWSLFWRRSCGLRSHCGPTAVPLRFQCGSTAVFRLQVAPERRFLPPVASPTLHPPPPLLFTHTHTHTHTHTNNLDDYYHHCDSFE